MTWYLLPYSLCHLGFIDWMWMFEGMCVCVCACNRVLDIVVEELRLLTKHSVQDLRSEAAELIQILQPPIEVEQSESL